MSMVSCSIWWHIQIWTVVRGQCHFSVYSRWFCVYQSVVMMMMLMLRSPYNLNDLDMQSYWTDCTSQSKQRWHVFREQRNKKKTKKLKIQMYFNDVPPYTIRINNNRNSLFGEGDALPDFKQLKLKYKLESNAKFQMISKNGQGFLLLISLIHLCLGWNLYKYRFS